MSAGDRTQPMSREVDQLLDYVSRRDLHAKPVTFHDLEEVTRKAFGIGYDEGYWAGRQAEDRRRRTEDSP